MIARCFAPCPLSHACARQPGRHPPAPPRFGDFSQSCAVPVDPKTQPNGEKLKYIHVLNIHHKESNA